MAGSSEQNRQEKTGAQHHLRNIASKRWAPVMPQHGVADGLHPLRARVLLDFPVADSFENSSTAWGVWHRPKRSIGGQQPD